MVADKTIRMGRAKSVLKYRVGDAIVVRDEDFGPLAKAFFADLESKFL